ncbi:MAG: glycosyltransferase [Pirellulaceae bacterium]
MHKPVDRTDRRSISLILPAFNEVEVIAQAVREAEQALSKLADVYEIIVVDDGSTDGTAEQVERLSELNHSIRLVRHETNQGYGAALRNGFAAARMPLVAFTDADCQFDLSELDRFVLLAERYDVVCGYRIDRKDTLLRCVYSKVYNLLTRCLLGTQVRDVDCALKMFHADVVKNLEVSGDGFLVNSELLVQARQQHRRVVEVGVSHRPRTQGESTVSVKHIPKVLISLARYWWNGVAFPVESHDRDIQWTNQQQTLALAIVLLASFLLMMPQLSYPLIDPDETRYAQIAIEMLESGDWITPTLNQKPYMDKPPLMYWLTATSFQLCGQHPWAARLPSVLSAFATVMTVYLFGRRLVGTRAAFIGSLALLLSGGFVLAGRFLILDSLLTFLTTLCLLSGFLATRELRVSWGWWIVSGFACALGVLTKGPVALVLCVPPLFFNIWLRSNQHHIGRRHWTAFALSMAICVPWYVAVWKMNPEFGDYFFFEHNFKRFIEGSNHPQGFWFYLPVLLIGMFPASLLLPSLAVFLLGRSESMRTVRSKELGCLFLGTVWILAFFTISSCKLPTYILPAIPMTALMIGSMLDHTVFKPEVPNRITEYLKPFPQRACLIVLAVCMVAIAMDVWFAKQWQPATILAAIGAVAAALSVISLWNRECATDGRGWAYSSVIALVVLCFAGEQMFPNAATERSLYAKAAELAKQYPNAMIVFFDREPHAATMSLPAKRIAYFDRDQRERFSEMVAKLDEAIVIADKQVLAKTREDVALSHLLEDALGDETLHVAHRRRHSLATIR